MFFILVNYILIHSFGICHSVYASSIPTIPIQVLATTGSYSGASVVFHSNVAKTLLADGTNLASKLCAKFQTTSPQFQYQGMLYTVFIVSIKVTIDFLEF